jgi:hypothetical protein
MKENLMYYFIGIDPGKSGGIAVIKTDNNIIPLKCGAYKMPGTERDIYLFFNTICKEENVFACIEFVSAMPKQGVSSTFNFGRNYGFLRGMLVANSLSFREVTPQTWQKNMSVIKKRHKNARGEIIVESNTLFKNRLKQKAQNLYPNVKMTLATCDAVLIAEYLRLMYLNLRKEEK